MGQYTNKGLYNGYKKNRYWQGNYKNFMIWQKIYLFFSAFSPIVFIESK